MNDAPPVTKTVFPAQNPSAVVTLAPPPHFLSDFQPINYFCEFSQFLDSIIVGSGGPRRLAHGLELDRVGSQRVHSARHFCRAVRIRSDCEPALNPKRYGIGLIRRYSHDGLSRRQDPVHFAGHHHAFQTALHSNDVRIGSRQHRGNLAWREKLQKTNIARTRRRFFDLRALRAVAHKHESHTLVCEAARRSAQRWSFSQILAKLPGSTIDPPTAMSGYRSRML